MVFVTVDEDRNQLRNLTRLLVSTFPGSVIYQYSDLSGAVLNTTGREIDAVFASTQVSQRDDYWQYLSMLRRKRPNLQVVVLSDEEPHREAARESGTVEYLIRPLTGQKLHDAICA